MIFIFTKNVYILLIFINRIAGEIIRLVASVSVSVCLSVCVRVRPFAVGALLFEPFDL